MSELQELYQELIIDHNRKPRNFIKLDNANRMAKGVNPLCGDEISLYLRVENDVIREVSFQGHGCAISTASASLMTEFVKDKTQSEVIEFFNKLHTVLTMSDAKEKAEELGKLAVLAGVSDYPARVKCATLAWHTLNAALEGSEELVSTE